jgi:hypothetical protein
MEVLLHLIHLLLLVVAVVDQVMVRVEELKQGLQAHQVVLVEVADGAALLLEQEHQDKEIMVVQEMEIQVHLSLLEEVAVPVVPEVQIHHQATQVVQEETEVHHQSQELQSHMLEVVVV